MQKLLDSIKELYKEWSGKEADSLDVLPISGSERRYFRLHGKNGSVIGTYGANIKENETFIYFSQHFNKKVHFNKQSYQSSNENTIWHSFKHSKQYKLLVDFAFLKAALALFG